MNEIIQVLAKYGFASWLQAVPAEHRSFISNFAKSDIVEMSDGERLRHAFAELGVTFAKIGGYRLIVPMASVRGAR